MELVEHFHIGFPFCFNLIKFCVKNKTKKKTFVAFSVCLFLYSNAFHLNYRLQMDLKSCQTQARAQHR